MEGIQSRDSRSRRSQGRRRRFTWRDTLAALLMVAVCVSVFLSIGSLGKKAPASDLPKPSVTGLPALTIPRMQSRMPVVSLTRNAQMEKKDTDWKLILVNNQNAIPEDYEITLAELPGGEKVDQRIYAPLMAMLEAAKEGNGGQFPIVVSGYRTQETQQFLYDDKIAQYQNQGYSPSNAKQLAEQWVAVPGHSEHQIGLAVDINGAIYDIYPWLQENSYQYGFIFRYPGSKTEITGVAEEVWHYRYVGVEAATEMYEKGLCLEEYLAEKQREGNEPKKENRLRVRRMSPGAQRPSLAA